MQGAQQKPLKRSKPQQEESAGGAPEWMVTFSDMTTLLLTFFVLLLSMSEIEVKKFRETFSYFTGNRGILHQPAPVSAPPNAQSLKQMQVYEELVADIAEMGLAGKVDVYLDGESMRIVMLDSVTFYSGQARLRPEAYPILNRVAELLQKESIKRVWVEGHTDNVPIATAQFPSNWELSGARAAGVVRYLIQHSRLNPERFAAAGYADTRPVASNDTPAGRAQNRRVEIRIEWQKP
ncbi:MAG: OmpA family protein [Bacteroidetes bacterium]|nr:OmpA family protein [Rhodothermia bacterium]MCS7154434.1 OmpA family protein [Bacteroidota bacterium]MCX7906807.1 OmpA family protein [Bacteroidota bacterium]MDW8136914.1 OmpA family protein [Bacteroidota bacterium]MDW8285216.1 OmpA family protein [Bacteroidota bacterium]